MPPEAASPPSRSPTSPSSTLFSLTDLSISFPIVGRRHYAHLSPPSQAPPPCLLLLREPQNHRDPLALKAFYSYAPTPALLPLGHAPARLSASLAPLLDLGCLHLSHSSVSSVPRDESADVTEEEWLATVTLHPQLSPSADPHRVARLVRDLLDYVEWQTVDRTHRFIRNFQLVAHSTCQRFAHLLTPVEQGMVAAFSRLSPEAQHLWCRLAMRKQVASPLMRDVLAGLPEMSNGKSGGGNGATAWVASRWFQVRALQYRQVPDIAAAVKELIETVTSNVPEAAQEAEEGDLPPQLTSPCKLRVVAEEATYASHGPSSPSTPKSQGMKLWEFRTPPSSPHLRVPPALRPGRAPPAHTPPPTAAPPGAVGEDDNAEVPGFLDSSESSPLAPTAFYTSLLDCLTATQLRDLCTRLDVKVRAASVAALKSGLLQLMQRQRTMSGRCMVDDPRVRRTVHALFGPFVRLCPRFLLLCQRLYRLFFLSDDVSHSSIASASSPMLLDDLGRARWAKPSPPPPPPSPLTPPVFPSRAVWLAWDVSLQLAEVMAFSVDDFEAELRAGFVHTPLALACLEEGYVHLLEEGREEGSSHLLPFTLLDRCRRMQAVRATAEPHLFPTDYPAYFPSLTSPTPASPPTCPPLSHRFLLRFRAAASYASVCHQGIHILEREHRYPEAASLLFRLLALPYLPQRRGTWFNRLSLNLATHLACKRQAMAVCARGLADPAVRTGDRVELQRRWYRLWRDKEGGNGEGLAPHVDRWDVPLPDTAKRRPSTAAGKRRRPSTGGGVRVKVEEEGEEEGVWGGGSPRGHPTAAGEGLITQVTLQGRPVNREVGVKSYFYLADNEPGTVEELALSHYETLGYRGVHCEGSLFGALFGLLMWDVVWDGGVEGVWLCPYQSAPLDMDEDEWYERRAGAVERRLGELRGMTDVGEEVARLWWLHYGERCRGLQWKAWTVDTLQAIVRCMSSEAVAGVMDVMARDYHHWLGGLPDLVVWRPGEAGGVEGKKTVARKLQMEDVIVISSDEDEVAHRMKVRAEGVGGKRVGKVKGKREGREKAEKAVARDDRVRLVEVKGPRDRLSPQQVAWLHVLAPIIRVEVCYVREDLETL